VHQASVNCRHATGHTGASGTGVAGDEFEFSDADDSSSESSDSELGNDDDAVTTQQCSSTTDSDSAPDCPDDRDTAQNCSSDKDSGSDIDVNIQISADVRHAARGDSQQRSDASANAERSRFLSAERQCRLCKTGHDHPYHFFFECAAGRFPSLCDAMLLDAALQYWRILAAIRDAVLNEDHLEIYDLDELVTPSKPPSQMRTAHKHTGLLTAYGRERCIRTGRVV
jgi:hypothetical protein